MECVQYKCKIIQIAQITVLLEVCCGSPKTYPKSVLKRRTSVMDETLLSNTMNDLPDIGSDPVAPEQSYSKTQFAEKLKSTESYSLDVFATEFKTSMRSTDQPMEVSSSDPELDGSMVIASTISDYHVDEIGLNESSLETTLSSAEKLCYALPDNQLREGKSDL